MSGAAASTGRPAPRSPRGPRAPRRPATTRLPAPSRLAPSASRLAHCTTFVFPNLRLVLRSGSYADAAIFVRAAAKSDSLDAEPEAELEARDAPEEPETTPGPGVLANGNAANLLSHGTTSAFAIYVPPDSP